MSAPNNVDWGGLFSRVFGGSPGDATILQEVESKDPELGALVRAAMLAFAELGHGFLPEVYRDALAIELEEMDIAYEKSVPVTVQYKGHALDTGHIADLVCYGDTLVLLHTADEITREDDMTLVSHLKATGHPRGILFNFGPKRLDFRRVKASGEQRAL